MFQQEKDRDIEDSIQKYYRVLNVAKNKLGQFLNYSNSVSSVAELIAYADGYAARYTKRDLPESVAAAFELNAVADLFETAKEAVNKAAAPYSFDIEASEIAQFLDSDLRNVEISADNGALSFYGEFDDAEAEEVGEKVKRENLSFLQGVREGAFTVPGDGCVDFESIFKVLEDTGYKGYMLVEAEQDPAKANPLEYAIKARKFIKEHAGI